MALIENLENDGWQDFLRHAFQYALKVLKEDRFRQVGSSVDDLRSWLAAGGVARMQDRLGEQMEMRRFSPDRKVAVNAFIEQIVAENRGALLDLMADNIIPGSSQACIAACGFSGSEFQELLERMLRGERPFEEWMHAHGHSDADIAEIYRVIDRCLMQHGIIPSSLSRSNIN
jgi:hypothetical protein